MDLKQSLLIRIHGIYQMDFKKLISIIFILSFTSCATVPQKWDTTDKALLGANYGLAAVDTYQTIKIVGSSSYHELNPVIAGLAGISPVLIPVFFIGVGVATFFVADNLDSKYRKVFLVLADFMSLGAVSHNFIIGVH
jgi:hypothetical protein